MIGASMERKNIPQSETRLTLLYALSCLGSATEAQLNRFLTETGLMNYITMVMTLTDLESAHDIARTPHPLGNVLELTEEGTYMLKSFQGHIPTSARTRIEQKAPAYCRFFESERQTPATLLMQSDGRSCLNLEILEGRLSVLTVMLIPDVCPTFVQQRWIRAAAEVYRLVTETLETTPSNGSMPENATLVPISDTEWKLFLQSSVLSPDFALAITLPDSALLSRWASAWPQACPMLRESVLRLLREVEPNDPNIL